MSTCRRILICCLVVVLSWPLHARPSLAQSIDPSFDPNQLIADAVFADKQTFGNATGIQKFLESKGSVLANTAPEFLIKLKEPTESGLKTKLDDPQPHLSRLRSAAELIWDAAQQSGLNPQVILVMLQKEQGLITSRQTDGPEKLQRALDAAVGFDCPDATGCGTLFPGFYFQLFGNLDTAGSRYLGAARTLMKWYNTPGGRGPFYNGKTAQVGDIVELSNTLGGFDGVLPRQTVMLKNRATAALYRYTPYVYNGNYNFYRYFNVWFKYPNGTIFQLAGAAERYIVQNGQKLVLPEFVAASRGLDLTKTIVISPTEVQNYQDGGVFGPADNTVAMTEADKGKQVFLDNQRLAVSDFVLRQRKLDAAPVMKMTAEEAALFPLRAALLPLPGTVIRGSVNPQVYLVAEAGLKNYTSLTFKQYGVAKQVKYVSEVELEGYPKLGFVPPKDGTIVRVVGGSNVFEVVAGTRRAMSPELQKNRKIVLAKLPQVTGEEVSALPVGPAALPREKSFFKTAGTGELYFFKGGQKKLISSFVARQKGITPDFTFTREEVESWPLGLPVMPKDGTLIKSEVSKTVYWVDKGKLRPATLQAFQRRKFSAKKIAVLPETEVAAYPKGDDLVN